MSSVRAERLFPLYELKGLFRLHEPKDNIVHRANRIAGKSLGSNIGFATVDCPTKSCRHRIENEPKHRSALLRKRVFGTVLGGVG